MINIASMAGIMTVDVTSGPEGGLAAPGTGTFSYGPSKAACIHLSKMQATNCSRSGNDACDCDIRSEVRFSDIQQTEVE